MFRLKEYRHGARLSQKQLAEQIGVSRSTIAMWELEASQPDHEMLRKLARFFHVSIDALLDAEQPSKPIPDDETESALLQEAHCLSPCKKHQLLEYAHFLRRQEREETPDAKPPNAQ